MLGMITSTRLTQQTESQEEASPSPAPSGQEQSASEQGASTAVGPAVSEEASSTAEHLPEAYSPTTADSHHSSHKSDLDTTSHQPSVQQAPSSNMAATDTDGENNGVSTDSRPEGSSSGQHTGEDAATPGVSESTAEDAVGSDSRSLEATQSPASASHRETATLQAAAATAEAGTQQANGASEQPHPADQLTLVNRDSGEENTSGSAETSNQAAPAPDNASKQSGTSSKQQDQNVQYSATVGTKENAPKTPTKKSPKKGGLVNVQRPAVKGYSIHRSPSCPCAHCLPLILMSCCNTNNTCHLSVSAANITGRKCSWSDLQPRLHAGRPKCMHANCTRRQ